MSRFRVALVVLTVAVMGCASPASSPTAAPSSPPPGACGAAPGGSPTAAAASRSPSAAPGRVPPDAALLVPDGDPVVGQLGSYTWGQEGSDAPWLPGSPAVVDGARSLRFGLSFEVPVTEWQARYATPGEPAPGRAVGLSAGALPLEVSPPPVGSWTVALTVIFAAGRGEATYYWRIDVP